MTYKTSLFYPAAFLLLAAALFQPNLARGFVVTFDTLPEIGEDGLYRWGNADVDSNVTFIATDDTTPANPIDGYATSLYSKSTTGIDTTSMSWQAFADRAAIGSASITFNTRVDGIVFYLGSRTESDGISPSVYLELFAGNRIRVRDVGISGEDYSITSLSTIQANVTHTVTVEWDYTAPDPGFSVLLDGEYARDGEGEILSFAPRPQGGGLMIDSVSIVARSGSSRRPDFFIAEIQAAVIPEPGTIAVLAGVLSLGLVVGSRKLRK